MKKLFLFLALAFASNAVKAQITSTQIADIKTILTGKTWKTASTMINGSTPTNFESTNNIHNINAFPTGDRFKFSADGTFTIIKAAGGTTQGIWDVNPTGQLVFNPGQNGGTAFGLTGATAAGFAGRTIKRLGMCNVTSLYEVSWVPAQ
jgi:lysozyme family protein